MTPNFSLGEWVDAGTTSWAGPLGERRGMGGGGRWEGWAC